MLLSRIGSQRRDFHLSWYVLVFMVLSLLGSCICLNNVQFCVWPDKSIGDEGKLRQKNLVQLCMRWENPTAAHLLGQKLYF